MSDRRPIGVFDSGVGGLSVLLELKRELPHENFVFLADQLYVPYGEKSKQELISLTKKITNYFIKKHNIKLMVMACNTATCYALDELRKTYNIPIVGTVPAVKPASERTKTGIIGVISTPATSKSETLKDIIGKYFKGKKIYNIGCKDLENAVEAGEINSPISEKLLTKYLRQIKNSKADYLVLGCTHYPFLKQTIRKIMGRPINLIDGSRAIARRTRTLLSRFQVLNKRKKTGKFVYLTTGEPRGFSRVASTLLRNKVTARRIRV